MRDHLEWNSLETRRSIAKVTMLCKITHNLVAINPDFYISSQTSLDTNSSAHPLTTSNSASSLIQLFFGMHYHLMLPLLLLWISLNDRYKPTITKQFSILYTNVYVNTLLFLFFYYWLIVNIWSVHADAWSSQLTEHCIM